MFFDPHKVDVSDELKKVFEAIGPYDDKVSIYFNFSNYYVVYRSMGFWTLRQTNESDFELRGKKTPRPRRVPNDSNMSLIEQHEISKALLIYQNQQILSLWKALIQFCFEGLVFK